MRERNQLKFGDSHAHLSTEGAGVLCMLGDFNLLHHLPEGRAITRAVFTNDPHLLRALGLLTTIITKLRL